MSLRQATTVLLYSALVIALVTPIWLTIALLVIGVPLLSVTKSVNAPDRIWKNPYYRYN